MLNILDSIREHQQVIEQMALMAPAIEELAQRMTFACIEGHTIFWMGNGGSAADAQHLAAELVGRYKQERRALASLSLSTDTSILTSLSNDYDFTCIFSRQLEALCKPGDIVVGLSTSGNSPNIIEGIQTAKRLGAYTVGMTGAGGALRDYVDCCLSVPSLVTARIQEAHILIGHMICEWIEMAVSVPEHKTIESNA